MNSKTKYPSNIQSRDLFGKGKIDYICTHCLVIVEEPDKGCPRCRSKQEKKTANLNAFLKKKAEEEAADLI